MTKLSKRIRGLTAGTGDGWSIHRRAVRLRAQGMPVIDLTVGEPDVRTDPEILSAMDAAARGGHTGYSAIPGTDALRDAIAARVEERTGVRTARGNVLVTPGGQSALFSALMAATDPGAEVLFPDPFYATYPGTIRAASAAPVRVPTRASGGFQPAEAFLRAGLTDRTSAMLVNSPNNPTGAVYSRATFDAIARVARDADLWLISDEVYDTQVWSGDHLSPRALPDMADRTLVVGSMSKSHAMTGSRVGWLIGPETAIDRIADLSTHTTYGIPGFVQDAALHALSLGRAFEERIAAPFRRRRDACLARLAGQQVVGVIPSGGAMYVMLDIRATGLPGLDFATRLLDHHHVAVMPGESFGDAAAGHVRVALTRPDHELLAAIDTIVALAGKMIP
ncbi:pyridoxal phosphate-dependent aminotransferase [Jannaschia rubra]|nr:pyridoxal phosphate-dependent aminotransferase [Jannaschia rubra]